MTPVYSFKIIATQTLFILFLIFPSLTHAAPAHPSTDLYNYAYTQCKSLGFVFHRSEVACVQSSDNTVLHYYAAFTDESKMQEFQAANPNTWISEGVAWYAPPAP